MGFSLSSFFDPAGITTGDKGDWVNNALDPIGGMMQNFGIGANSDYGDLHNNVGDWMDNMADTNSVTAQDRWNKVRDNPQRMLYTGGDLYTAYNPVGTRVANKWEGDSSTTPGWDIYGGQTPENYQNAENRGIDTSNAQGGQAIGSAVGKAFLNAYTFGLGSTAADALNSWGNYDNAGAEQTLKNGAKNYAINYVANGALDYAGGQVPSTGGYSEAGGGYVSNNDYGGTGGFNLGKSVGAGQYSGAVNSTGKAAAGGAINSALQGGNRTDIGKAAGQAGIMTGAKQGADAAMGYIGNMYNNQNMPDTGTLGGTMYDENGENSATMGGVSSPDQISANRQAMSTGQVPTSMPLSTASGRETAMSASNTSDTSPSPVSNYINTILGNVGGGKGLGNYGDVAGSLFGMYNAYNQRKKLQQQQSSLQDLFSPNSPYAQMARQRMERQDAAAGRRSQYGPREMQLAALLADRQAQTMPQQMQYQNQIGGYDNAMVNNGLKGLGSVFNMYKKPGGQ